VLAGDYEALDVSLRGVGDVAGVGEQSSGPTGAHQPQVPAQGFPEAPREGVVFRPPDTDADARRDLPQSGTFDHERGDAAQIVL
jgi:hypothetical protein